MPRNDDFARSRARFEELVGFLDHDHTSLLSHADLEDHLDTQGRKLLRQLYQDHLDLRTQREQRLDEVIDADGVHRGSVEACHERRLQTIFGEVVVNRLAYRRRGHANLHPADAALNLPVERHSHGLRRLAAIEASRGSFDEAVDAIGRTTGQHVGKRQTELLAQRAAADFDAFYAQRPPTVVDSGDLLVLSCDGKGIVMRPDALRLATQIAAAKAATKLTTRLSKGEKANRKRMAEVGTVYDATPAPRIPDDIICPNDHYQPAPGPVAHNKWVMASVVDDTATVIGKLFDEAERRDPDHQRTWVALVDGNRHQITNIKAEAKRRGIKISIVVDFIHVLEYLWKAAWCFYNEADRAAETWVGEKALAVLNGNASAVAGAIRRKATWHQLTTQHRKNADQAADYLLAKAPYLDYPTALSSGWPIATGVIEGTCRHLVKDRMDLTGARWGLTGAEAILKLRAIRTNGDFHDYWRYHLTQEHHRTHATRYADQHIPNAA